MHESNERWWAKKASEYPACFSGNISVVDFGSMDINGSLRKHIGYGASYVGVDWRPGRNVDVVSFAHDVDFDPGSVDTVVSASMLEHDPYWERSVEKMAEVLKPDGALFITWGSMTNAVHTLKASPLKQFHPLKCGLLIRKFEDLCMGVQSFEYEDGDYGRKYGLAALHVWQNPAMVDAPKIEELMDIDRE